MKPVVLYLAFAASAECLGAQRWCSSSGAEPPLYDACALSLDGDALVRGANRERIAISESFRPLPLKHFVSGDSAVKYALLYERDGSRSGNLRFVAGAALMVGSIMNLV